MKALYIVLAVVLLAGCAPSSEELTATAVMARAQTQTAAPTLTPTPTFTPTFTPTLTATRTPKPTKTPVPTPAAVGETVAYENLQITLLEVVTHTHIVTGGYYYYYSKPGEIFIDMTVLVRNRRSDPVKVRMKEIYIVDETDSAWYPNFGGVQTVELERRFNPMASIKIDETYSGGEVISFEKDTYLRLIFYVKDNQDLLFGIQDSLQFAFPVGSIE
jgi:hypothetical protein